MDADTPAPGNAASPATPPAPVRIRNTGPRRPGGRAPVTPPAATSSVGTEALPPTVQRSRTLLPGRALKVSTGSAEGFSAAPPTTAAAGGSTARPVVAATWRRDVQQSAPGSARTTRSSRPQADNAPTGDARTGERRASRGATPRRTAPRTRPTEPASSGSPQQPRTPGPTPASAAPAPGATVQRAAHTTPAPRHTTSNARGPQGTAAPQTERATSSATAPARSRSSAIGGALQRLVQRRPVRDAAAATTPPSPSPDVRTPWQTVQRASSAPAPSTAPADRPNRRTTPSGHTTHTAHTPERPIARPASPTDTSPPTMPPLASSAAPTAPPQAAPSHRPVPVVRPHPPVATPPGATVVPVQRMPLPVVPDPAGPSPAGPTPGGDAPPPGPPALSVRVPPRPHPSPSGPSGTTATPGQPPAQAQVLQRAAVQAGITGVPVKAVPPKGTGSGAPRPVQRAAKDTSGLAPAAETSTANAASRISGAEIEELARRLIDPVSRLIRADVRRGRERAGRLHDGRR
ncbi:hypothetical protein [Streptomyces sp. DSS69]|uniref:hypothetical protein n=1 Tax=Streptomyces sp. DSS69 TaxID=3113369 RepID=UPI0031F971CA